LRSVADKAENQHGIRRFYLNAISSVEISDGSVARVFYHDRNAGQGRFPIGEGDFAGDGAGLAERQGCKTKQENIRQEGSQVSVCFHRDGILCCQSYGKPINLQVLVSENISGAIPLN
jgi:hypothetical protein